MKALVYRGPELRSREDKPYPTIPEPTDIVVRIVLEAAPERTEREVALAGSGA